MNQLSCSSSRTLTSREERILDLVATAAPNKTIAVELQITVCTVKRHLNNIFDKTGMGNRVELALYRLNQQHQAELAELRGRIAA